MTTMSSLPPKAVKEIKRCRDFKRFLKWAKILTKKGKIISPKLKVIQKEVIDLAETERFVYVLKARQVGITTGLALFLFHRALLQPNYRVAVVAHTRDAAEQIFEIYKRIYNNLPSFLKFKVDTSNVRELKFFHGGLIKITSAGSQGLRGSTYNAIHASEIAFWPDADKAVASILQTASDNAIVVLETTAQGLNQAHKIWAQDNGFHKKFISWLDEPTYTRKLSLHRMPSPEEQQYVTEHKLSAPRANWYMHTLRTKCAGSQATFDQEYPASPELAFITSGRKFFTKIYPTSSPPEEGLKTFKAVQPFHVYAAGVDTASGSPAGDYSTCVIVDVTDIKHMETVAALQIHAPIQDFASQVFKLCKKYEALAIIETNSYGLSVQDYFASHYYPHIYNRIIADKTEDQTTNKLGWWTDSKTRPLMLSKLNRCLSDGTYSPIDLRLMGELNSFVYSAKGKPEASSGAHDDLVVAAGLALQGLPQIPEVKRERQKQPDKWAGIESIAKWEALTDKEWESEGAINSDSPPSSLYWRDF